jgi:hypothetical protein
MFVTLSEAKSPRAKRNRNGHHRAMTKLNVAG